MSFAAVLSALIELISAAPGLVSAVKDVIAAFEGGGKSAAQAMLASKVAADTAAAEEQLQTPIGSK